MTCESLLLTCIAHNVSCTSFSSWADMFLLFKTLRNLCKWDFSYYRYKQHAIVHSFHDIPWQGLFHHRACFYQYLLKPTHAPLKSLIKTHYSKNIKMFVSFSALHVSVTSWPSSGAHCSSLGYLLAICSVSAQPYPGLWPALCLRCCLPLSTPRLEVKKTSRRAVERCKQQCKQKAGHRPE